MKIIFDSEEQKGAFIHSICPSYLGLYDHRNCGDGYSEMCEKCWENAIDMVVDEKLCKAKSLLNLYYGLKTHFKFEKPRIIYKDDIISVIGEDDFYEFKKVGLIKCCGILNGREMYELCGK